MTEKIFKYIQWLLYGLMIISAIFGLLFYLNPGSPDLLMYWGYVLFIIATATALTLSIYHMAKNPKGSKKAVLYIGVLVALGVISYFMSQNTYSQLELEKYKITANSVRLVGAGLYMTYFIAIIAIGVLIYSSVSRFFTK
jgi:NADH:ubiquinone oxidoreductase subunit 6 (subunit J)